MKKSPSLGDSNPNPIIEIDFQGQITYVNGNAKIKFPDLIKLNQSYPIIQDLIRRKIPQKKGLLC